jgi:hypothetical protein
MFQLCIKALYNCITGHVLYLFVASLDLFLIIKYLYNLKHNNGLVRYAVYTCLLQAFFLDKT